MTPPFLSLPTTQAAVVCYDLTDAKSFDKVKFWVNELLQVEEHAIIALVGTKLDLLGTGLSVVLLCCVVLCCVVLCCVVLCCVVLCCVVLCCVVLCCVLAPALTPYRLPHTEEGKQRGVPAAEVKKYAHSINAREYETSARSNRNIDNLFQDICEEWVSGWLWHRIERCTQLMAVSCDVWEMDGNNRIRSLRSERKSKSTIRRCN
jgi:GTPase SAR1 family protein